jgi:hypothetical protein
MTRTPGWHLWTEAEVERLFYLRDIKAMSWPDIARDLDIDSPSKCAAKYQAAGVRKRGEAIRINGVAPNKVLIERERRQEAHNRLSLSGQLFGDPPPGFNALDKRRGM